MPDTSHTAILGAGVIGASWAALFLASGRSVAVFDPAEDAAENVRAYIDRAWPAMTELGLTGRGAPDRISFHTSAAEAVPFPPGWRIVRSCVKPRSIYAGATWNGVSPRSRRGPTFNWTARFRVRRTTTTTVTTRQAMHC